MKDYIFYMVLFCFFFPLCQKVGLIIQLSLYGSHNNFALVSYYHDYGLLSMKNLIISSIAASFTYLFHRIFNKWKTNKK